jgi:uncharacterized protein (DUF1786 family)
LRILALDIGSGTEDILLYDDQKELENSIKIVLPSPATVYSKKVKYFTKLRSDLFIKGETIGGGTFSEALKSHLDEGLKVILTKDVAYSIRNKLEEVETQGFQIIDEEKPPLDFSGKTLETREINISIIQRFLNEFEEDLSKIDIVAIAVQDHGTPKHEISNRKFRLNQIEKRLKYFPKLESLAYEEDELPNHFIRMTSAIRSSNSQIPEAKTIVMDTSMAAILGCLEDQKVSNATTILSANIGNEHFTASIISEGNVLALLEHHTSLMTPPKIESLVKDFIKGEVSNDSIFQDGGHGAFYTLAPERIPDIDIIIITGPNRAKIRKTNIEAHFAAPGGDMMMTGPIGLIKAAKYKVKEEDDD